MQHTFNACNDHEHIRHKYDELSAAEVRRDAETRDQLLEWIGSPTFQICGIVPANDELTAWQDQKQEDEGDAAEIAAPPYPKRAAAPHSAAPPRAPPPCTLPPPAARGPPERYELSVVARKL